MSCKLRPDERRSMASSPKSWRDMLGRLMSNQTFSGLNCYFLWSVMCTAAQEGNGGYCGAFGASRG